MVWSCLCLRTCAEWLFVDGADSVCEVGDGWEQAGPVLCMVGLMLAYIVLCMVGLELAVVVVCVIVWDPAILFYVYQWFGVYSFVYNRLEASSYGCVCLLGWELSF